MDKPALFPPLSLPPSPLSPNIGFNTFNLHTHAMEGRGKKWNAGTGFFGFLDVVFYILFLRSKTKRLAPINPSGNSFLPTLVCYLRRSGTLPNTRLSEEKGWNMMIKESWVAFQDSEPLTRIGFRL
ncbi:hypothetical protein BCR42DRAFT_35620 [Absidia repens]|uniref:Uncharacterized protein n=1 Tax=Absidia repens TaxID=90262 RepID=A0A1X2IH64_9FUNG|nr:hypothetical protein BCR42DRAFT_35620 [Absidia repens]